MGQYKDIAIPDYLDNVIAYMQEVDSYREELMILGQTWDLLTILGQMGGDRTNMTVTRGEFRDLTEHLISILGTETLAKTVQDISARSQVTVDIIIRNLFERTADIGFLATDDDIRDFLKNPSLRQNPAPMIARFQEYVAKYSVYHNIILLDTEGNVLVQLDQNNPVTHSTDPLIRESLQTSREFVETFRHTDLLPTEKQSLVYSFRVTENNRSDSARIGVLCLCFRFDNEMEGIFDHLSSEDDWSVLTLLDQQGRVIASSSKYQVPVGATLETALDVDYKVIKFAGRRYIAKTARTNGYQGFFGLGWYGHVMLPLDMAFDRKDMSAIQAVDRHILGSIVTNPNLFSQEIQNVPVNAEKIQRNLDRTVWNGNILPEDGTENSTSSASKVLLWEISKTGMKTKSVFERSIENLHKTVVSTYMDNVGFIASLCSDIMDRNLYERANDCRWWALTSQFRRTLSQTVINPVDVKQMSETLAYINGLYTVYTNLFVYDQHGKVIAVSNARDAHLVGRVLNEPWILDTLKVKNSQVYKVSPFEKTPLYSDRYTYIYNASILNIDHPQRVAGGIGIVFDSEPEFLAMLNETLPRDPKGDLISGCFSVFSDRSRRVIASTRENLQPGDELEIDHALFTMKAGQSAVKIVEFEQHYYAVGIKASSGYREYKSEGDSYQNDVFCLVFMELDSVNSGRDILPITHTTHVQSQNHPAPRGECLEIATFYIGSEWFGVSTESVVEAIELTQLSAIPGTPDRILGCLFYHDQALTILNPGETLGVMPNLDSDNVQVVILRIEQGLAGIVVDRLGEIPKIEQSLLQKHQSFHGGENFIDSLATPYPDREQSSMLVILSPDELYREIVGDLQV